MRYRLLPAATLLAAAAGVHPTVNDPHATGPHLDRWQATLPGAPAAVFDVAVRVPTDSSYRIADARKDAGLITTAVRKPSDVQRGGQQLRSMLTSDEPVTLHLVLPPAAGDSTRLTLSGDYAGGPAGDITIPISAYEGKWPLVRRIGEAIAAAAHPAP